MRIIIYNGTVVTPERSFNGSMLIEEGIIREITDESIDGAAYAGKDCEIVDARGQYVLPGLVDLHCDILENVLQPRKKVLMPIELAVLSVQAQLLSAGITSMFHAISFNGEEGLRSNEFSAATVRSLQELQKTEAARIRNFIHMRYELSNHGDIEPMGRLLSEGAINLFSVMDHSPQYGKYKTREDYKEYVSTNEGLTGEALEEYIREQWDRRAAVDPANELRLLELAAKHLIPIATHDDITPEKLDAYRQYGSTISEFPLNEETARHAERLNMFAVVGAPNLVRNGSHQKNMSARFAVKNNLANILCSDYYPFALLAAVFILFEEGVELSRAVNLVSLNPARAAGLADKLGSLEVNKAADVILVHHAPGAFPYVQKTMVGGRWR